MKFTSKAAILAFTLLTVSPAYSVEMSRQGVEMSRQVAVISGRRQQPHQKPGRSARVPEIEDAVGFGERADADAVDVPFAVFIATVRDAEGVERSGGSHHVLALEQTADHGLADRHCRDHQRAVRNRLVARNANGALDAIDRLGNERAHWGPFVRRCRPIRGVRSVARTARPKKDRRGRRSPGRFWF